MTMKFSILLFVSVGGATGFTPPIERAKTFHRGSRTFHEKEMGNTDEGAYVLDTSTSGNSNSGHNYGTKLSMKKKRDLIEYLKTL